ncbi:MAG: efflux RND transporter permease subunit [Acidobacteriota bacterium]|nr:efflux RND transporter permease subunit [Acidobacteriota bacterium]MDQ2842156.1 efflux RND transporter permease subunit [Acidobacteriota bacterium]
MRFTDFFIRRAITTTLIMAGILAFGLLSYFTLPVSNLPAVEYPTIEVSASLPGANPDVMAASVATPLENQFSNIDGINSMSSSSSLGSTDITLQFDLKRTIDAAAQDVQAAISRAQGNLPTSMPAPPSYSKVNPAARPILYIAVSSKTMPMSQLDQYAEQTMARRVSMVSGVAQVQVFGAQKYAVRVQADPAKLAAYGVDLEQVRNALSSGSVNLPAGSLYGYTKAYTVASDSQLTNASQFKQLIVTYKNGSPLRLDQLGNVLDSVSNNKTRFWIHGNPSMIVAVQRQPGANTVEVADNVKALLPTLKESMPAGVEIGQAFDASQNIRESIADVKFTLVLTICLVIAVIFVFLRNVSATLIPSLAVPLSLLGTFAAMKLLGFTIDMLSMMAMTLSVGFVVDDAIVMLENIVRHMEMGKSRLEAAIEGAREVGFTIVSMTVSLVAVFIPVLFMSGIIGRLLREFSVTIAIAVLISGVISLTLTPMLCSRFLRHESHPTGTFYRSSEKFFNWLNDTYRRTLLVVLRFRKIVLLTSVALTAATVYLFVIMPKGFMPTVDQGFAFGGSEASEDTSFDKMSGLMMQVNAVLAKNPWITNYGSGVGNGGQNQGFMFLDLKEDKHRPKVNVIIGQLEREFMKIPGLMVFLQSPPLITLGQNEGRAQYSVALEDADTAELYKWAPVLEAKLRSIPQLQDIYSDLRLSSPRLDVHIDRNRALALGVNPDAIANTLYDAYGNRRVTTITAATDQYDVLLEVLPRFQRDPAALQDLYIRSSQGKIVPLSAVSDLNQTVAPLSVNHIGQLPAVNFQFNLKPGVALSQATKIIDDAARQIGLPDTISFSYQGTAAAFQNSLRDLGILLLIAVVVIYLVLGILYESFIHPITILSGLPAAGIGALLTLLLFGEDLNLYSFVGIILLIGIVKKNAIMMIDFALAAQRNEGKSPEEAIFEGCMQRFRPIMMTTMAALLGTLPIAFGTGAGGEARRPLGIAVVGGLIVSQLLTLYITPVIYVYLDRFTHRRARKEKAATVVVWPGEESLVKQ